MSMPFGYNVVRVPAHLAWNPTDYRIAYPHGGSALGSTCDIVTKLNQRTLHVTDEGMGDQVIESIYLGESVIITALLREPDPDALGVLFPNTATGTVSREKRVKGYAFGTAIKRAGYRMSAMAGKLLISPIAYGASPFGLPADYATAPHHFALLLYNAIPILDPDAMLNFSFGKDQALLMGFLATPNTDGKIYEWSPSWDL